jgi:L-ascorbate metabolism protein UlaG (beta-lactamase superfamily)
MMTPRARIGTIVLLAAVVSCAPLLQARVPSVSIDYTEPRADAITFWGHACAYIDVGGFGIVTDPVFSSRFATIRRRLIPAPPYAAFDQTRVVLISHAHQDHLDPKTLARFAPKTVILAPEPAARYIRKHGLKARAMRPGDEYPFPGGTIIAVAAHHPGGRLSLKARSDGRAIGYIIRTSERTIYYTGDTEYFTGFAAVGADHRPDITLLNLNAHLHSQDALKAIRDLRTPMVVPIHFGAYDGKSTRRGPQWRSELIDSLGSQIVSLEVAQNLSLADVADEFDGER